MVKLMEMITLITDDNGGGSSSDTTCSTLLDFYFLNADVNDTDEANFGVSGRR